MLKLGKGMTDIEQLLACCPKCQEPWRSEINAIEKAKSLIIIMGGFVSTAQRILWYSGP